MTDSENMRAGQQSGELLELNCWDGSIKVGELQGDRQWSENRDVQGGALPGEKPGYDHGGGCLRWEGGADLHWR